MTGSKRFRAEKMNPKVRVNITVDKNLLEQARGKLKFFGGKLSTLFNAYLEDFVKSMNYEIRNLKSSVRSSPSDKDISHDKLSERLKELEKKMEKLEGK